jgi:hypothetical protein
MAVTDYTQLDDGDLFDRLRAEYGQLPTTKDRDERYEIWQEIKRLDAEIQRRWPPLAVQP